MEAKKGAFEINFELFSINGEPLTFALIGFKQMYVAKIDKLIEAYGGKLTEPDVPGTIVFADASVLSTVSCQYYDIRFLHDSIAAQQLQNLQNYRISSSNQESISPVVKRPRRSLRMARWHLAHDKEVEDEYKSLENKQSSSLKSNGCTTVNVDEDASSEDEFFDACETLEDIAKLEMNQNCQLQDENASRSRSTGPSRKFRPWTEEEHKVMIDFLITHNVIYRALSSKIWEQCLQESSLLQRNKRTAPTLYMRYQNFLRRDYAKYTNDPDALERFKDLEVKRPRYGYIKRGFEVDSSTSTE